MLGQGVRHSGRPDAAWRPPRRDHATIRRAVEEAAAAQASPGICITNVGIVDPALGPHANRVTGYRTVVNRTGANYGVVLHLAMFKGAFAMALAFGTPCMDRSTVEKVAQGLHERATHPGEFLRP
ncbi:hypothetical protein OG735_13575 [Streptomyces sp. NBC_01210]|uniref:hypothetical protein n=1 Tax=Streptomyces sp. NBC_01210 TaxID=2903774 RepID=UPI002E0E14D4|nr:hypothetical protein OG735_13575 [Streptomyces sp. NBC_01210]